MMRYIKYGTSIYNGTVNTEFPELIPVNVNKDLMPFNSEQA